MDILWSVSTTMRNPERAFSFLSTIAELEGEEWTPETQKVFQSLLIKNRFYLPTSANLSEEQINKLNDGTYDLSYAEAREIFEAKNYVDSAIRGRTSFDPIEKLGLVELESRGAKKNYIKITPLGRLYLNKEIQLEDVVFNYLLKFQYPNPLSPSDGSDYDTKPFINTLRLIKKVNTLCTELEETQKGISKEEFGIFVLSIKSYSEVDQKAKDLLEFRKEKGMLSGINAEKYVEEYIQNYLSTFKEPVKNVKEYTDNIVRYLRLTKYITIRGNGYYIDLEPRRTIEIEELLKKENGAATLFSLEEYKDYMNNYDTYVLPFETIDKLTEIATGTIKEINRLNHFLNYEEEKCKLKNSVEELKLQIKELREKRTKLQNLLIKYRYQDSIHIEEAIFALSNLRNLGEKPSIALEKWVNIALNIINDAKLIKPNSPMGDDNEPTFTAPAGVPDIECYYSGYNAICEVTMLTDRSQWFNEGQPVMRHLRDFEEMHTSTNYCLFIAPKMHVDTINTFWSSIKYEYQGRKQKIVPLTISQLIFILEIFKKVKEEGKNIHHKKMQELYESCICIDTIPDSTKWGEHIKNELNNWAQQFN